MTPCIVFSFLLTLCFKNVTQMQGGWGGARRKKGDSSSGDEK